MTKIPVKRFPKPLKYCPLCECPVVYFGTVHNDDSKNMVRCLNEDCQNTLQPEQALEMIQTGEGKSIYWAGFERGEDAGITERLSDKEDLSEVE